MVSVPGLYFVIARDDRARFIRPDPRNGLHTVGIVDLAAVRRHNSETPEPRCLPELGETRFLPLLANRISADFGVDLFTHLVLVALPPVLQELIGLLDASTTASLIGTLAQDLMTLPDHELWPHLKEWIRPVQRA
jgi:hypothetical protein